MMGNYFGGGYGHMSGPGFILMIIFWGLVVWAVITGIRMISGGQDHPCRNGGAKEDGAMKLLRERYVKGEITDEQFERMKKTLEA